MQLNYDCLYMKIISFIDVDFSDFRMQNQEVQRMRQWTKGMFKAAGNEFGICFRECRVSVNSIE